MLDFLIYLQALADFILRCMKIVVSVFLHLRPRNIFGLITL